MTANHQGPNSMIDLNNKTVLVTGASRGIGAVIARTIAKAGGDVILHYGTSADRTQNLAEEIGAEKSFCVQADFTQPHAGSKLWRDALAWRGRIDVVVNNAGVYLPHPVDTDDDTWHQTWATTLQVNLIAAADISRCAVRHWQGCGGGILINIASRAAHRGEVAEYWAYAASKGGLISMSKTIARHWGQAGVLAYCIAPGFVNTEMASEAFEADPSLKQKIVGEIPLGEIAPPEDVANCVAFLASGLAKHATGTTIDVNGASYVR